MHFVTFHIDPAQENIHPNTTLQTNQYLNMIDLMFRSARIFHPACDQTVISNRQTNLSIPKSEFKVFYTEARPTSMMLDRTKAQTDFLESYGFDKPVAFIDSDILLNGNLGSLFQSRDFDIALTFRESKDMPINGGLILVNNQRPDRAKKFFRDFYKTYVDKFSAEESWYGDQLAIIELIGKENFYNRKDDLIEANGLKILLLPCETYNFSPRASNNAVADGLPGKFVIHFKGQRKFLMQIFWDAFLDSKERPLNLLRRWRGFQKRKGLSRELENAGQKR